MQGTYVKLFNKLEEREIITEVAEKYIRKKEENKQKMNGSNTSNKKGTNFSREKAAATYNNKLKR